MKENRIGKKLYSIGIIIIFLGIFGSFILGAVFPSVTYDYSYFSGYDIDEAYNWSLAIIGSFVSFISGMCFIGFSEIIFLLQDNINKQTEILKQLKNSYDNDLKNCANQYWDTHQNEKMDIEQKIENVKNELNKLAESKYIYLKQLDDIRAFSNQKMPAEEALSEIDSEIKKINCSLNGSTLNVGKDSHSKKLEALKCKRNEIYNLVLSQREKTSQIVTEKTNVINLEIEKITVRQNTLNAELKNLNERLINPR